MVKDITNIYMYKPFTSSSPHYINLQSNGAFIESVKLLVFLFSLIVYLNDRLKTTSLLFNNLLPKR